jgi:GLPGLI family protein
MKYIILSILQLLSFFLYATAQNIPICYIKFKDYGTNIGTNNYWFYQDKLIMVREANFRAIYLDGFPVLANGVMHTETDTLKYNKEFNEFINDLDRDNKKKPVNVKIRKYNSDTTKTSIFRTIMNTNYILIDTVAKLNKWVIAEDTLTFMGYKCQKAIINYKQENYTAWFTTQLPYNAGPDVFRGLPGLILKICNQSETLGFEATEIHNPYKGIVPKFNSNGVTITRKEWVAIANEINRKSEEARKNQLKQENKEREIQNQ